MPPTDSRVLADIIKAYDVRGTVPDQLNTDVAHALGVAFARFCGTPRLIVARDMRPSGVELVDAFARGAMEQGVDVVDLGLASTDLVYYAAGTLDELYVIAAAVIGGTSLAGGLGTIAGAMLGALVMQSLQSGMSLLNFDSAYQDIVVGIVLALAVYLGQVYRRRAK
mgnify:CR=1 FL=1